MEQTYKKINYYSKKVISYLIVLSFLLQPFLNVHLVYADSDFIYRLDKAVAGDKTQAKSGEGFTYNITYSINGEVNGKRVVHGFRIEEELPRNVEYVSSAKDGNVTSVTTSPDKKKVIFQFKDEMETGSAGLLTVTVRFKTGCAKVGEVTEGGRTVIYANNMATGIVEQKIEKASPVIKAEVHEEYRAKVQVKLETPNPVLGEEVHYSVSISGEPLGGRNLQDVTISFQLPPELDRITKVNVNGTYDEENRIYHWKRADLKVGEGPLIYRIYGIYEKAGTVTSQAKMVGTPYGSDESYEVDSNVLKHGFYRIERGNPTLQKENAMKNGAAMREYSEGQIAIFRLDNFSNTSNGRIDKMEVVDMLPSSLKLKKVVVKLSKLDENLDVAVYDTATGPAIATFQNTLNQESSHEVKWGADNTVDQVRIVYGEKTGRIKPYTNPGSIYVYAEVLAKERDTNEDTLKRQYQNEAIFHTYKDEWIEREVIPVEDEIVANEDSTDTTLENTEVVEQDGEPQIVGDNEIVTTPNLEGGISTEETHNPLEELLLNLKNEITENPLQEEQQDKELVENVETHSESEQEITEVQVEEEKQPVSTSDEQEIGNTENQNHDIAIATTRQITSRAVEENSNGSGENKTENTSAPEKAPIIELVKETVVVSSPVADAKFLVSDKKAYPSIAIHADKSAVDYNDNIRFHMVLRNDGFATSDIYSVEDDAWKLVVALDHTVYDTSNVQFTNSTGGEVVSKRGTMKVLNTEKITDGNIDYFILTLKGTIAPWKNDPLAPVDTDLEVYWNTKIKDNSVRCGSYNVSGFLVPGGKYNINWLSHNRKTAQDIYKENIPNGIGIDANTDMIYVQTSIFNKFIGNIKATKLVKGELDDDYGLAGETTNVSGNKVNTTTLQGGRVDYKVHVANEGGNGAIKNIVVVDKLPNIENDTGIFTGARNSKWNPILIGTMNVVAEKVEKTGELEAYYSTKLNPDLTLLTDPLATPNEDWSKEIEDIYDVKYVMFRLKGYEVGPAQYVDIEFPMVAQAGAPMNEETFNSVAVVATYQDISNGVVIDRPFTAVEAGKVSHKIVEPNDPTKFGIGNRVFFDANNNGIMDDGEEGINGVKAALYKKQDGQYKFIRYTYSADGLVDGKLTPGFYMFPASLPEGDYEILMLVPKSMNLEPAKVKQGNDATKNSSFSRLSEARQSEYALLPEEVEKYDFYSYHEAHGQDLHLNKNEKETINFGLYRNVNVKATIFYDDAMNGIYNPKNVCQEGVVIHLHKYNKVTQQAEEKIAEKVTDATGTVIFEDVEPIDYVVEMVPNIKDYKISPLGTGEKDNKFSKQNIGTEEAPEYRIYTSPISTVSEFLPDGQNKEYNTYGYVHQGKIAGNVFEDDNGNGVQDTNDVGTANVDVVLYRKDENGSPVEVKRTKTDAKGHYAFEHLIRGYYKVQVVSTKVPTKKLEYQEGSLSSTINRTPVGANTYETDWIYVDRGDSFESYCMGFYNEKSITIKVFDDKNHNGKRDVAEQVETIPHSQLKVILKTPSGTNPKRGETEQNQPLVEDKIETVPMEFKNGYYIASFTNVQPSEKEYTITVQCEDENYLIVPVGGEVTFSKTVSSFIQSTKPDKEWIGAIRQGKLTGELFDDIDDNGYQATDPALKKVAGKPIKVFLSTNKLEGNYHGSYDSAEYKTEITTKGFDFEHVKKGSYYVYILIPKELEYKSSKAQELYYKGEENLYDIYEYCATGTGIEMGIGEKKNQNFGFYKDATVSAYYFLDFNKNGLEEVGDTLLLDNFKVELWNGNNTEKVKDFTKELTKFQVKIRPGNYTLRFIKPDFYTNYTKQNQKGSKPSDTKEQADNICSLPAKFTSGQEVLYRSGVYRDVPIVGDVFCEVGDRPKGIKEDSDLWYENGQIEFRAFKLEDDGTEKPVLLGNDYTYVTAEGDHTFSIPSKHFVKGNYRLEAILPAGYKLSPKAQATQGIYNMFEAQREKKVYTFTVQGTEDNIQLHMGIYKTASINLQVYLDKNGNQKRDEDEPLILDNWKVDLIKDGTRLWESKNLQDGKSVFDELPVGEFELKIELPSGYYYSNPVDKKISIYSTDFDKEYIVGVYKEAELKVKLFHDEDEINHTGKALKPDVSVNLYEWKLSGEKQLKQSQKFDDWTNGMSFIPLYPTKYQVELQLKPHYEISEKTSDKFGIQCTETFDTHDKTSKIFTLDSGSLETVFTGIYRVVTIKGNVTFDQNEIAQGVEIQLQDQQGNVIKTTQTDKNGNYYFDKLRHGTYTIHIKETVFEKENKLYKYKSYTKTLDTEDLDDDGEDIHNIDLSFTTMIRGTVYVDKNGNGIQEDGEQAVKEPFEITLMKGDQKIESQTLIDGTYEFNYIPTGEYQLVLQLPEDYTVSDNVDQKIVLQNSWDIVERDIGVYVYPMVQVVLRHDEDVTRGIAGCNFIPEDIGVELHKHDFEQEEVWTKDTPLQTYTMGELEQQYAFHKLKPAKYCVRLKLKPHYEISTKSAILFGLNYNNYFSIDTKTSDEILLESGMDTTIFASIYRVVTLKGKMTVHSGTIVKGMEVVLKNEDGNIVATTKTDEDGNYSFEHLRHGIYTIEVKETIVSKDGNLYKYQGYRKEVETRDLDDDGIDIEDIALSYITMVRGNVFLDRNGNGVQDDDEDNVSDPYEINLSKDGTVVQKQELQNGTFEFNYLQQGEYVLSILLPKDYAFTKEEDKVIKIENPWDIIERKIGVYRQPSVKVFLVHDEEQNSSHKGQSFIPKDIQIQLYKADFNDVNVEENKVVGQSYQMEQLEREYEFNKLSPAKYCVELKLKPHYEISSKSAIMFGINSEYSFDETEKISPMISLKSGDTTSIFAGIYRVVTVKGKLVTSQNNPITNTKVILKNLEDEEIEEVRTNSDGEYEFQSLRHGTYHLEIEGQVVHEDGKDYKYASLKTVIDTEDSDDDGIDIFDFTLDKYLVHFTANPNIIVANGKTKSDFLFEVYKSNGELIDFVPVTFDANYDADGNLLKDSEKGTFKTEDKNNIGADVSEDAHKITKETKQSKAKVTFTSPDMEGTMRFAKVPVKATVDLGKGMYLEDEVWLEYTPDYIVGTIKNYKGEVIPNAPITIVKDFEYIKNRNDSGVVEFVDEKNNSYEYIATDEFAFFVYNGCSDENGEYKIYIPYGSFQKLKNENEELSGTFTPVKYELDITIPKEVSYIGENIGFRQNAITKNNADKEDNIENKAHVSEKTIVGFVRVESPDENGTLKQEGIVVEYTHENGTKVRYRVNEKGLLEKQELATYMLRKQRFSENEVDTQNVDGTVQAGTYTRRVYLQVKNVDGIMEELEVGSPEIIVLEDGDFILDQILIDPYGTIVDEETKEPLSDVTVTLYDYLTNKKVELPVDNRAMSNNENPQQSNILGKYAWYVPKGSYYMIATKSGYETYDSRIHKGMKDDVYFEGDSIDVIDKIVRWDFEMKKKKNNFAPPYFPPFEEDKKEQNKEDKEEKEDIGTSSQNKGNKGDKTEGTKDKNKENKGDKTEGTKDKNKGNKGDKTEGTKDKNKGNKGNKTEGTKDKNKGNKGDKTEGTKDKNKGNKGNKTEGTKDKNKGNIADKDSIYWQEGNRQSGKLNGNSYSNQKENLNALNGNKGGNIDSIQDENRKIKEYLDSKSKHNIMAIVKTFDSIPLGVLCLGVVSSGGLLVYITWKRRKKK